MWLKLSWYQFKIDCHNYKTFYVISRVTTRKIPTEDAHRKWEGNQSMPLQKNKWKTKEVIKRGKEGQNNYKTNRKQWTKCQ